MSRCSNTSTLAKNPEHPWDQLPGEPNDHFAHFLIYKAMPSVDRCVKKSYKLWCSETKQNPLKAPRGGWEKTAARWHWRARAEEWDKWLAQKTSDAIERGFDTAAADIERAIGEMAHVYVDAINGDKAAIEKKGAAIACVDMLRKRGWLETMEKFYRMIHGDKIRISTKINMTSSQMNHIAQIAKDLSFDDAETPVDVEFKTCN